MVLQNGKVVNVFPITPLHCSKDKVIGAMECSRLIFPLSQLPRLCEKTSVSRMYI